MSKFFGKRVEVAEPEHVKVSFDEELEPIENKQKVGLKSFVQFTEPTPQSDKVVGIRKIESSCHFEVGKWYLYTGDDVLLQSNGTILRETIERFLVIKIGSNGIIAVRFESGEIGATSLPEFEFKEVKAPNY